MNDELKIELRDETHAVPVGTTPYQLADREGFLEPDRADPILGASINNRLISLRHPLARNGRLKLLRYTHRYGHYFYRRGLTLVLNLAFSREYPDRDLIVGHSLENGYYYQVEGVNGLSREQLSSLEREMDSLIEEDIPFEVERYSFEEARDLFASRDEPDKLRLLDHWNPDSLEILRAGEMLDVAYFPAPASSRRLSHFELRSHKPGFILRFPDPRNHKVIPEPSQQTSLFQIYQESQQWAKIINVGDVGALNRAIAENDISDVIKISEALHEKKISNIADTIHDRRDRLDVIPIAGPTSSGKTTFSKRLMVQLRVNGLNPVTDVRHADSPP
jgi:uridine kinase